MSRPVPLTLSLDLQIHICEFLHPCQILVLRQTCKAFHEATSHRIVWIHALYRICLENSLFLPSFSIPDMSVAELERAATAPRRWIALSFSKDRNEDSCLLSRTIRPLNLNSHYRSPYLVPGGRYLVAFTRKYLAVWDLGYVSDSDLSLQPTEIWGTAVKDIVTSRFHPTPDDLGMRILTYSSVEHALRVFEIYPQKEIVQDPKIAELILDFLDKWNSKFYLYGNRVVIYDYKVEIVIVWDFIANTTASWSVRTPHEVVYSMIFRATETAIMILYFRAENYRMWIFQIPPLVTKTPLFNTEDSPEVLAPIFAFDASDTAGFPLPDCWYNGDFSSIPIYFDVGEGEKGNVGLYKADITSDFSNLSFTPIAVDSPTPVLRPLPSFCQDIYRICENSAVNIFLSYSGYLNANTWGFDLSSDRHDWTRTPAAHFNNETPLVKSRWRSSFCPASARLIYRNNAGDFFIRDFL